MAFNAPDLATLISRVQSDIEGRLAGAYARPRRYLLNILASVQAALASDQHQHLNWLARQVVPDKADDDILVEHCDFWGLRQKQATGAKGLITVIGQDGAILQAGTRWRRPDGVEFSNSETYSITGTTAEVLIAAISGGRDTNTPAGVVFNLIQPINGVQGQATASEALAGGADKETFDALRGRLRQRLRFPPHGGAPHDYERWALEVPGITRAWCLPLHYGEGTVAVVVANDDSVDPRPDATVIQRCEEWIDGHTNPVTGQLEGRPTNAVVSVFAPDLKPLNPAIRLLPDSEALRGTVTAELNALMVRSANPGATLLLTDVQEAIKIAGGMVDYQLASPTDNTPAESHQMHTLGTITWL
ncbi:baseplate J/gp47 family protein [uncultured Endozoicomonas sp.]|uniref:baseplate J/gp47 family protein n=1 Tax=uncultured Endozoicomonas sp. TaxID=432652 RepID=UPI002616D970|nr:baseplate J/gp47 family protein [uncultured Endozoicomonas sp.]